MTEVLIVDDKASILKTMSMLLQRKGFDTCTAANLDSAKELLNAKPVDLVITDLRLGESKGESLIEFLRANEYPASCIVMTAFGSIESAVACMKLGAHDYLTKPVSPDELLVRIDKVLEQKRLTDEVQRLRAAVKVNGVLEGIVAESGPMREVIERVRRIHAHDLPVLITGETGTGKEVIAQAIHNSSHRADRPFIAINCCTLPEDLLDSELFGHVKGAFTGATSNTHGLFHQADGGTLFLDEIGDVSPRLQSKLLRVLQEGEVRRVGGTRAEAVDVRVVAATNRNLEQMMNEGDFRPDLFYRLNVVPVHIAPLRDRVEDIRPLVERFVSRIEERFGRALPQISRDAWRRLLAHPYPGNVRQLENVIERTYALAQSDQIDADDIQFDFEPSSTKESVEPAGDVTANLEDMITRHIRQVLSEHDGNQVAAARSLGISRSTLRRKLGLS